MGEERAIQGVNGAENHDSLESSSIPTTTAGGGGEKNLRRAILLISSLISESHTIRVFSVKWQVIRGKLEEMNTGLIAAENCHSTENQALFTLISSIISTVDECQDLARRCINVSYSGKLLMQSDLDLICSKFDSHIRNLSAIYTAGILSNMSALVVSKPGIGASREDMKFYVKDLFTRLKIGNSEMKKQALVSLNEIVTEDEKYAAIVVELNEILLLLAKFLDSPEVEVQEEAAKLVSVIAGFDWLRSFLGGAGIIAPLIRVLEGGSSKGKECAIKSLQKLTENCDNAWSLSAHGGVTALLNVCSDAKLMEELIGPACGVLRNLVGVEEITRFMIEEGAIPTFIKLVNATDELTQINSIEFLQSIYFGDESIRQMIIKEGGLRALIRVLDPKSPSSHKSRETALRAIQNLCFSSIHSLNLLLGYGFMDQLLYFLHRGEAPIQELALKAALRLSRTSEEAKKAMGRAGFMPEFIKFLEAKSYEVCEMAAEVLSVMVMVPKNKKKFVEEARNINLILQLIDPKEGNSGNLKFLLAILLSVSSCSTARKKILNSVHMKKIEKLAEDGVSDAKKIIRKLSSNRLQTMLNKILHS
ncbi:hypothetical protein Ancab_005117 [Ancistrocladus abbreviatus]